MKPILLILILSSMSACGVKGKPQPPLYAPPMGRGKPTLNNKSQGIKLSPLLSPSETPAEDRQPEENP